MFRVFEGKTANDVWSQVAEAFNRGVGTKQPSRAGLTQEILHSAMSIAYPTQRWVTSRIPPINPAFAIAEIVWIMTGRNDSAFLNYFNRQLPKFAGSGESYHGAYGYRLRRNLGVDQLERAYHAFKAKPASRQVVLQIWDGRIDLPSNTGKEASPDVPCNLVSILKVRGGRLEWMQIMRSNDLYRGLPYNLVQFTTLQEVMAGWLELEVGEYNQISNSLHVYESDLEQINRCRFTPPLANTDSLAFAKKESDKHFAELATNIEVIIDQKTPVRTLVSALHRSKLPEAFLNMLRLVSAEGARRRKRQDVAHRIMSDCTNPLYRHLFDRWLARFEMRQAMVPKRKIFISYQHQDLLKAKGFNPLKLKRSVQVDFVGRHLLDTANNTNELEIKSKIKEMLGGSSLTILLIGKETYESEWVLYELEQSLVKESPNSILAIRLKQARLPKNSPLDKLLQEAGAEIMDWHDNVFDEAIKRARLGSSKSV